MSGIGTMVVSALVESAVAVSPFVIGGMVVVAAEAVRQARRFGTHGALHSALCRVGPGAGPTMVTHGGMIHLCGGN